MGADLLARPCSQRWRRRWLGACLLCAALACHGEERRLREAPLAYARPASSELPQKVPGGVPLQAPVPILARSPELGATYVSNAWAVSEGKRLFLWYNCTGCHGRGGGGMGPPLIDERWIYGSDPLQIFETIAGGRPNGMPAFGSRVPEAQLWQLTAYVRSLSGGVPKAAMPVRGDELSGRASSVDLLAPVRRDRRVVP